MSYDITPSRPDAEETIRLLQEELAETNREVVALALELEKRVEKRTAELAAANEEMKAFTYSVSHDLRAPLRAITGFSAILSADHREHLPTDAQRFLDNIVTNAHRMEQLIEGLLRLSHLSRQSIARRPVNISSLVSEVIEDVKKEYPDRTIEIKIEPLPDSIGDQTLLRQVFANLLANAFKFTLKTPEPRIEVGFSDKNGERVYFIRDNGAGFDPKYTSRLFGVFQRLHRAEEFSGNGIGLSIVQRIIQRHGGRIWAEGKLDAGATFYFTLPA